jgi:hypothetical protein
MRKAIWLMRNIVSIMPKLGYIVLVGTKADPVPPAVGALGTGAAITADPAENG